MAMIEERDVAKFTKLYKLRFGVDIEEDVARQKLSYLVLLMENVYRPVKRSDVALISRVKNSKISTNNSGRSQANKL